MSTCIPKHNSQSYFFSKSRGLQQQTTGVKALQRFLALKIIKIKEDALGNNKIGRKQLLVKKRNKELSYIKNLILKKK